MDLTRILNNVFSEFSIAEYSRIDLKINQKRSYLQVSILLKGRIKNFVDELEDQGDSVKSIYYDYGIYPSVMILTESGKVYSVGLNYGGHLAVEPILKEDDELFEDITINYNPAPDELQSMDDLLSRYGTYDNIDEEFSDEGSINWYALIGDFTEALFPEPMKMISIGSYEYSGFGISYTDNVYVWGNIYSSIGNEVLPTKLNIDLSRIGKIVKIVNDRSHFVILTRIGDLYYFKIGMDLLNVQLIKISENVKDIGHTGFTLNVLKNDGKLFRFNIVRIKDMSKLKPVSKNILMISDNGRYLLDKSNNIWTKDIMLDIKSKPIIKKLTGNNILYFIDYDGNLYSLDVSVINLYNVESEYTSRHAQIPNMNLVPTKVTGVDSNIIDINSISKSDNILITYAN